MVQGVFDCIRLHQSGHQNVVALMNSTMSEEQEQLIVHGFDYVFLMLDGSDEGWKTTRECIDRLALQTYVKAAILPPGKAPEHLSDNEIRDIIQVLNRSA